jgi:hypothetical protein
MTRPSQRKRGQGQKSKPKQARLRLNENADPKVGKSGAIPLITPNVNDSWVIQELSETAAGALAVDSPLYPDLPFDPDDKLTEAFEAWRRVAAEGKAAASCMNRASH